MQVTATPQQTQTPANTAESAKTTLGSDYETFLKMLTAQMQNQDPLNPVDSADYAVQLATFSSVEQQVLTNDLLQGMTAQLDNMGMGQFASWIGMEARVEAPVQFSGTAIDVAMSPHSLADDVWLSITDENGFEVARRQAAQGQQMFSWAGTGTLGETLPEGRYAFAVESFANGNLIDRQPALAYARITESRNDGQGVTLVLEGGAEVASGQITALRVAG